MCICNFGSIHTKVIGTHTHIQGTWYGRKFVLLGKLTGGRTSCVQVLPRGRAQRGTPWKVIQDEDPVLILFFIFLW